MRSPLEFEPDLVAGVGLITVRWAALERQLADLLGNLLKIEPAGDRAYYAIGNFSQRIDLVEAILLGSLKDDLPKRVTSALFDRVRRLWKARNYLIHSHYAYVELDWEGNMVGALSGVGRELGEHPRAMAERGARAILYGPDKKEIPQPKTVHHGFAYQRRKKDGSREWVIVNKGTFDNHAAQLFKRTHQIHLLTKAVTSMAAPLRWGSYSSSHAKYSPRSLRNQNAVRDIRARSLGLTPRRRSSRASEEEEK